MKNLSFLFILLVHVACVPGATPTSGTSVNTSVSPEAEARTVTSDMKDKLILDAAQEEKVFLVNVVNLKVLKRLRESNETSMLESTRNKYRSEIKGILSDVQYQKFLTEFKDL